MSSRSNGCAAPEYERQRYQSTRRIQVVLQKFVFISVAHFCYILQVNLYFPQIARPKTAAPLTPPLMRHCVYSSHIQVTVYGSTHPYWPRRLFCWSKFVDYYVHDFTFGSLVLEHAAVEVKCSFRAMPTWSYSLLICLLWYVFCLYLCRVLWGNKCFHSAIHSLNIWVMFKRSDLSYQIIPRQMWYIFSPL